MNNVLDIPVSITEQLDSPTIYWGTGLRYDGKRAQVKNPHKVAFFATELDAYIAREGLIGKPGISIICNVNPNTFDEVNEKARSSGCTNVDILGDMKSGTPQIIDSWTVPCA